MSKLVGFYPGSFDPLTNGHLDVIERACKLVDTLVVAVGISATKKNPLFSHADRIAILQQVLGPVGLRTHTEFKIVDFSGLMVNSAREHGAKLIIRGTDRNDAIAKADKALKETVLLGCKTNTAFLRRLIHHPAFISGDVHTGFLDANPQIAAEPEMPTTTLHALLSAASLSTRPMRDVADSVPDMHAAIGSWRN